MISSYYPFETERPYPRNHWYVIASDRELDAGIIERTCLGDTIAIYRTSAGEPAALANACPHRRYPLSRGRVVDDAVRCGYHGATFDARGVCVAIPAQEKIPAALGVRAYPIVRRWQWLWIWPGDPKLADPALIPDQVALGLEDAQYDAQDGGYLHLKGRYQLLNENLLDLSHLGELHAGTLGTPQVLEAKISTTLDGDVIRVQRVVPNDPMNGFYQQAFGVQADVMNREQNALFYPPAVHVTELRVTIPGGSPDQVFAHNVIHAVTPETPTTTHYFWAIARNYRRGDEALTKQLRVAVNAVFDQDREAVELIERALGAGDAAQNEFSFVTDAGALRARRVMRDLILAEENVPVA